MREYAADRVSSLYAASDAATQSRLIVRKVILQNLPPQLATIFAQEVRCMVPIKVPQIVPYKVIHMSDKTATNRIIRLEHQYSYARSLADIVRIAAAHQTAPPDPFLRRVCRGVVAALVTLEAINRNQYVHGHLSLENIVTSFTNNAVYVADYAFGNVHSAARQLHFRQNFACGYDMYPDGPASACHDANQLGSILSYTMSYVSKGSYSDELKQVVLYLQRLTELSSFAALQESIQRIFESNYLVKERITTAFATPTRHACLLPGKSLSNASISGITHDVTFTPRNAASNTTKSHSVDYSSSYARPQSHKVIPKRGSIATINCKTENLHGDTSLNEILDISDISLNNAPSDDSFDLLQRRLNQDNERLHQIQTESAFSLLSEVEELLFSPQMLFQKLSSNIPLSTQMFELALLHSRTDIAEAVVTHGPLLVGANGVTGLILSVIYNFPLGVEKYISLQSGQIDSTHNTALTHAIRLNHQAFIRALAKAELHIRGPHNVLPLDLARSLNNKTVVNMLILAEDFQRNQDIFLDSQGLTVDRPEPYLVHSVGDTLRLSSSQVGSKDSAEPSAVVARRRPISCRPELLYKSTTSPLIAAVKARESTQTIVRLIAEHAGEREADGSTALYTALDMGMLKLAMLLAPHELMIRGRDGVFPLEYVMRKGMQQLALDLVDSAKDAIGELHWVKLRSCITKGDIMRIERLCAMPVSARAIKDKEKMRSLRNSQYMSPSLASQQILRKSNSTSVVFGSQNSIQPCSSLLVSGSFATKEPDPVQKFSQSNFSRINMLRDSKMSLINAVQKKNMSEIRKYLQQVCHRDSRGWTALMHAAHICLNAALPLLSAEYGMTIAESGITALMLASEAGNLDGVKCLAQYEGRMISKVGKTALIFAIESSHYKCAEALAFEANVWSPGCDSPLLFAIKSNKLPFAWLCIPKGCGSRDSAGATALMHSIATKNAPLAKALVPHESGMKDNRGMTALMYCVQYNMYNIALLLAEKEIGMRNNIGQTALSLAAELQNGRFLGMLKKRTIQPGYTIN